MAAIDLVHLDVAAFLAGSILVLGALFRVIASNVTSLHGMPDNKPHVLNSAMVDSNKLVPNNATGSGLAAAVVAGHKGVMAARRHDEHQAMRRANPEMAGADAAADGANDGDGQATGGPCAV